MSYIEPPWYFWLAAVPLYGTPVYVILWGINRANVMRETGKALKGAALGLVAWLALTILYFVASFILEPCLENCSRFRTPEGNARAFALILIYTTLAALIAWRLYRYGERAQPEASQAPPQLDPARAATAAPGIAAAVNRWIWYALLGIGSALVAFAVYLGLFAWANEGLSSGVRLFGTSAAFGCAIGLTGLAFRFAAQAHAKIEPWRWWSQALPLLVGYVAFGLAATTSRMLDRM